MKNKTSKLNGLGDFSPNPFMKNFMKNKITLIIIFSIVIGITIGAILYLTPTKRKTYVNFLNGKAYLGFYFGDIEEISLKIPVVIDTNSEDFDIYDKFSKIYLTMNNEVVEVTSKELLIGYSSNKYRLVTLNIGIPKVDPGIYFINNIILKDEKGRRRTHNIGDWIIEVKEGKKNYDIKINKSLLLTDINSDFETEITNLTDKHLIINGIFCKDVETTFSKAGKSIEEISNQENSIVNEYKILENQKGAFSFSFSNILFEQYDYITVKPFLRYIKNNKEYLYPFTQQSMFIIYFKSDESIKKQISD